MTPTEPGSTTPTYTVADNRGVRLVLDPIDDVVVGGVLFRVGTVDESLSTYGITHLIEHLALSELNLSSVHSNGAVTDTYTAFYAQGSPEAVVGFLNAVCRTLRNLPTARWRTEAKVLDAESAGRPTSWGASMGVWRYGAAGRGLRSQETEWGLLRLSDQEIADWSRRYFTAGNAVAYLSTATAPADLDLTLPHGNAVALPFSSNSVWPCRQRFQGPRAWSRSRVMSTGPPLESPSPCWWSRRRSGMFGSAQV